MEVVDIIGIKANTMYSALSNEIEKYNGVESLSGFENDKVSAIIGHKKLSLN